MSELHFGRMVDGRFLDGSIVGDGVSLSCSDDCPPDYVIPLDKLSGSITFDCTLTSEGEKLFDDLRRMRDALQDALNRMMP